MVHWCIVYVDLFIFYFVEWTYIKILRPYYTIKQKYEQHNFFKKHKENGKCLPTHIIIFNNLWLYGVVCKLVLFIQQYFYIFFFFCLNLFGFVYIPALDILLFYECCDVMQCTYTSIAHLRRERHNTKNLFFVLLIYRRRLAIRNSIVIFFKFLFFVNVVKAVKSCFLLNSDIFQNYLINNKQLSLEGKYFIRAVGTKKFMQLNNPINRPNKIIFVKLLLQNDDFWVKTLFMQMNDICLINIY